MAKTKILIGTSGFSYKEWLGGFYPEKLPGAKMLEYYAERMPTVEINYTFRAMPKSAMLEGWAARTPATFRFALKAPQRITHFAKLRDVKETTDTFIERANVMGERLAPVYANVSRGKIRAKRDPDDSRRSLYSGADVARLAGRRAGRRSADTVAAQTIGWGDPILASAISTVADGRLWYRGADAVELSERATLEEVAAILWQAQTAPRRTGPPPVRSTKSGLGTTPLEHLLIAVSQRAAVDPPLLGRSPAILKSEAQVLFDTLLAAALGHSSAAADFSAHARIAAAWRKPGAKDILRRALVLLADHELNASTFAVRVAASTGAALSACLLAGLATLSGPLHGGAARALQALLNAARQRGANEAVREWLARGELLPAFGHPLYPQGDPRAAALMHHCKLSGMFADIRQAAEDLTGDPPNVDFALAALADSYALPREAPFVIFALSRSVGWMAHALEQTATGQLIRPRARYVGPALVKERP